MTEPRSPLDVLSQAMARAEEHARIHMVIAAGFRGMAATLREAHEAAVLATPAPVASPQSEVPVAPVVAPQTGQAPRRAMRKGDVWVDHQGRQDAVLAAVTKLKDCRLGELPPAVKGELHGRYSIIAIYLRQLVALGRVVKTGIGSNTRYVLASVAAAFTPAAAAPPMEAEAPFEADVPVRPRVDPAALQAAVIGLLASGQSYAVNDVRLAVTLALAPELTVPAATSAVKCVLEHLVTHRHAERLDVRGDVQYRKRRP